MKSKIIAIINEKGGVAKTTTAFTLACGLTSKGYKVLALDLDAQTNLTSTFKGAQTKTDKNIVKVLTGEIKASEAIQKLEQADIIASSKGLAGIDAKLTETGKEYKLKEALEHIRSFYDFIIIDTAPALSILTINALTACDYAIIPVKADLYSLQGMEQLRQTIKAIKKYTNNSLLVAGVLLNHYNARSPQERELKGYFDELAKTLNTKVYKAKIRTANALFKKSIAQQESIFKIDAKHGATQDYNDFINELLEDLKKGK